MEGRKPLRADSRQVAGVAAVVAADDDHQVQRAGVEQGDHGVLAFLRRAADRVEGRKWSASPLRRSDPASPPTISPISSDSVISIVVWLAQPTREMSGPGRSRARRRSQTAPEGRPVPVADVVADDRRFGLVQHDQVVRVGIPLLPATPWPASLRADLAVDDRREAVAA
jgi:hypothetical protein